MKNFDFILGLFLGMLIIFIVASFISGVQANSWRTQVANHGCAEYYLDENHDRQWRWYAATEARK